MIVVINICPNCKGILGSDAVFCTKCGANIKALKSNKDNVEPINSYPIGLTKDDIVQPSDNSEERTENSKKHSNSSKVLRKYPFSNIATVCWLIAIALVIFGIILPIPEKHIDTWRTGALGSEWSGDEYTEYVGGDAYNIMIEASLRGGIIAGRTIAKTILIVSGIVIYITGSVLAKIERKEK